MQTVDCGSGTIGTEDGTCQICRPGHECTNATTQTSCANTDYAFSGSAACTTCPNNVLCNPDIGNFEQCGLGFTSTNGGPCTACPAGKQCNGAVVGNDCQNGFYGIEGVDQCVNCPIGYKCVNGDSLPQICAPGKYTTAIGQHTCTDINKGNHSIRGFAEIKCIPGEVSGDQADVCERVLVGLKAPGWGTNSDTATTQCAAGKYCPVPWWGEQPCPTGTYSTTDSYACTFCDSGTICEAESTSATGTTNCPVGYYCAQHLTKNFAHNFKNPCHPGTVNPN